MNLTARIVNLIPGELPADLYDSDDAALDALMSEPCLPIRSVRDIPVPVKDGLSGKYNEMQHVVIGNPYAQFSKGPREL
jgi:hypothetical protein